MIVAFDDKGSHTTDVKIVRLLHKLPKLSLSDNHRFVWYKGLT